VVQWLRRNFVTGFFVIVPLVISLVTLAWIFEFVDGLVAPLYRRLFGFPVPGLGILTTAVLVLLVGVAASNVIGKRLLQGLEWALLRVPVFRTIYGPVKQLVVAFSPDNEFGFKRVVIVEAPGRGMLLGFLTREFTLDIGGEAEPMVAVYVPTNHLYLGDIVIVPQAAASYPDLSVEDGVRIILTGGMAMPDQLRGRHGADRERHVRV
jgi:uncharacterized membrane protein